MSRAPHRDDDAQPDAPPREWPTYLEYKDSGMDWLDTIPIHWVVKKLKYIGSLKSGDSITSEQIQESGDFPVYGGNGLRGYTDNYTHEGDYVLIGRQGALCGNINYANGRFWASEHAVVVSRHSEDDLRWLGELLRGMNLNRYSMSAAQPGISVERIQNLHLPLPPLDEQHAIAAFLDRETAKIDALIAKKEQLIALLQEQRGAIISHAVTKGLDPAAPLKDSGVEWLGEIPAGWEVKRLKHIASKPFMYGANEAANDDNPDNPRFIRITDINDKGTLKEDTFRSLPLEIASPYLLQNGDILFARSGATVGKTFRYRTEWGVACFAGYLIRFSPDRRWVEPEFVDYFTSSRPYWEWISSIFIQATIQNISAEKYANLILAIPPLDEQHEIVTFLEDEMIHLDALISKTQDTIERLQEYRTALISAAVTGKIDVRGAV